MQIGSHRVPGRASIAAGLAAAARKAMIEASGGTPACVAILQAEPANKWDGGYPHVLALGDKSSAPMLLTLPAGQGAAG